jgi:hypothetical protein
MTEAMKAKEALRLSAIRNAWSAIRKKEIDDDKDLDDAGIMKVLQTQAKQLRESIEQFSAAARKELVEESEAQLKIIMEFLPKAISPQELEAKVRKIVERLKGAGTLGEGPKAMGPVMKEVNAEVGASAEGKTIQETVRRVLGL